MPRALTESQRAIALAGLATRTDGRRPQRDLTGPRGPVNNDEVAAVADMAPRTIKRAKTVLKNGTEDEIADVLTRVMYVLAGQAEVGGRRRRFCQTFRLGTFASRRDLAPLLRGVVLIGEPKPIEGITITVTPSAEGIAIRATPSRPADRR